MYRIRKKGMVLLKGWIDKKNIIDRYDKEDIKNNWVKEEYK